MRRGDVFEIRLRGARGREQRGKRYGVIVQIDDLLMLSTVIVAPTSTQTREATFRPRILLNDDPTRVLVEQLRAIDVNDLGDQIGRVTAAEQRAIDDALILVLGL